MVGSMVKLLLGIPEWIILAVTACVLLYLYASRSRNWWKSQSIISEPFALLFGPSLKVLYKPFHEIDAERYKKYGRFFGGFETGRAILFVAEPELVKQVLVKDFPHLSNRRTFVFFDPLLDNMMSVAAVDQWRRIRPAASPAFSTGKLRKMNSLIEDCAIVTAEHLKQAAMNEEDIDIKQFFGNYALDVIARCAFGTRLDSHSDQTNEFVTRTRESFSGHVTPRLFVFFVLPGIARRFKIRPFKRDTFLYFKELGQNIIRRRREQETRCEDFLQLMVDAQDGKLSAAPENDSERDNKLFNLGSELKVDSSFSSEKKLTEDEVMAQCVLFFVVGQDTNSTTIAYTLYLLAIHPEAQEKLRDEVDECFRIHGDHPSLDVVMKLQYLHCVVSEALRMYPPATRLERTPPEDYVLGDTGVKVRKGDLIRVPVYSMHYDPQYFPDPFTFKPERFSEENVGSIQPYTYLPFGAGPRNCIAMRFSLQTVKLCVMHAIRSVRLVRTEKTKVSRSRNKAMKCDEPDTNDTVWRKRLQLAEGLKPTMNKRAFPSITHASTITAIQRSLEGGANACQCRTLSCSQSNRCGYVNEILSDLGRTFCSKVPLEFHNGFRLLTAKDITLGIRKRT